MNTHTHLKIKTPGTMPIKKHVKGRMVSCVGIYMYQDIQRDIFKDRLPQWDVSDRKKNKKIGRKHIFLFYFQFFFFYIQTTVYNRIEPQNWWIYFFHIFFLSKG